MSFCVDNILSFHIRGGLIVTARNEVGARLYFTGVCDSVNRGGVRGGGMGVRGGGACVVGVACVVGGEVVCMAGGVYCWGVCAW